MVTDKIIISLNNEKENFALPNKGALKINLDSK